MLNPKSFSGNFAFGLWKEYFLIQIFSLSSGLRGYGWNGQGFQ